MDTPHYYYASTCTISNPRDLTPPINLLIGITIRDCTRDEKGTLRYAWNIVPIKDLMYEPVNDASGIMDQHVLKGDFRYQFDFMILGDRAIEKDFWQNIAKNHTRGTVNSLKAATEIERAINRVLEDLNADANLSNAERKDAAKKITKQFMKAVTYKRYDHSGIKQRSVKSFLEALEEETKKARARLETLTTRSVKISSDLIKSAANARILQSDPKTVNERKKKTALEKNLIKSIKAKNSALAAKKSAEILQLQLFTEEEAKIVKKAILFQASDYQKMLVATMFKIRQQAYYLAVKAGVPPESTEPFDAGTLTNIPWRCAFPSGLRGSEFHIAANDLLKAIGKPINGSPGTRERARAEAALTDFAHLFYDKVPTKDDQSREATNAFTFKAYTPQGSNLRVFAFRQIAKEFLLSNGINFRPFPIDFIPYVNKNFKGSPKKAEQLIGVIWRAVIDLEAEFAKMYEQKSVKTSVTISIHLKDYGWPSFRSAAESAAAKQLIIDAISQEKRISARIEKGKMALTERLKGEETSN